MGGTDFIDTFNHQTCTYWSATNTSTFESALGYIPEIPWNDSCASALICHICDWLGHHHTAPADFAITPAQAAQVCAPPARAAAVPAVAPPARSRPPASVSGTCAGYAKPSWQSGLFGNPNDGVRDLPDVSLFSANGIWGHFLFFCYSDTGPAAASLAPVHRADGARRRRHFISPRRSWRRFNRS